MCRLVLLCVDDAAVFRRVLMHYLALNSMHSTKIYCKIHCTVMCSVVLYYSAVIQCVMLCGLVGFAWFTGQFYLQCVVLCNAVLSV